MTSPASTAGFPRVLPRLASLFYDAALALGVLVFTFLLPHILIGEFLRRTATPLLLWAHLFLALLVYFVGFWTCKGQTLAMRTWRFRLQDKEGHALRPAQALLRYLLCWPSIGLFGAGLLWAVLDPERQFLHDRLAGTRIVRY